MKSLRSAVLVISCFLISAPGLVLGQAGSLRPSADPANISDHARQREQWFQRGRVVPGQSAAALRYRAHLQKMQKRAIRASQPQASGITEPWTPLGPAPLASDASGVGLQDYNWVSGRATSVAIDPADPSGNTVYAGGAYGGVWKSSNAGPLSVSPTSVVWTPITDNQPTLAVGSIAVQPQLTNPNPTASVILVGTGETDSSVDSYYGLGILRSPDAGTTWTLISQDSTQTRSFAGLGFSQIAFSSTFTEPRGSGSRSGFRGNCRRVGNSRCRESWDLLLDRRRNVVDVRERNRRCQRDRSGFREFSELQRCCRRVFCRAQSARILFLERRNPLDPARESTRHRFEHDQLPRAIRSPQPVSHLSR